MELLSLPEDMQLLLVRVLAHKADSQSLAVIASLAASCSEFRRIVSTSGAWRLAADALWLGPREHGALPELCHAAAHADGTIFRQGQRAEEACCMLVALRPRSGGWMRRLMDQLGPLGLCSVVAGNDLASTPFVIVACDSREPDAFLCGVDSLGVLGLTAPCGLGARCNAPAALGCLHCRRHGGQGAQAIVKAWSTRMQSGSVHRVIFAAQSPEVRDSFRRAVRATQRGTRLGLDACRADGRC